MRAKALGRSTDSPGGKCSVSEAVEYMIARTVEVREYDDIPDFPGANLDSVTFITVLEGRDVDLQELPRKVRDAAVGNQVPAYVLEDKRTYAEIGASGSGQEVILKLVTAGNPAMAGSAGAIVTQLLQWARECRRRNHKDIRESGGEAVEAAAPELGSVVFQVKAMVRSSFGGEEDDLNVDDAEIIGEEGRIELSDRARGRSYKVRVSEGGWVTSIRELRR